jgi:hypothetical protein
MRFRPPGPFGSAEDPERAVPASFTPDRIHGPLPEQTLGAELQPQKPSAPTVALTLRSSAQ